MDVIVGDFGIVVVPRDGTDTERIINHSSVLRKHKVMCYKGYLKDQKTFKCLDLLEYYFSIIVIRLYSLIDLPEHGAEAN